MISVLFKSEIHNISGQLYYYTAYQQMSNFHFRGDDIIFYSKSDKELSKHIHLNNQ